MPVCLSLSSFQAFVTHHSFSKKSQKEETGRSVQVWLSSLLSIASFLARRNPLRRVALHRFEHVVTSFQHRSHFFRHVKGRPQVKQSFASTIFPRSYTSRVGSGGGSAVVPVADRLDAAPGKVCGPNRWVHRTAAAASFRIICC